ncbi:MAG TPA: protoporphyrinogen oxidase [Dermatophilaceae bacterium]|nr:protoporphyrinogen oxidase [Dermatophilaceae bacterium]
MPQPRVAVVGAGIAGLAAAFELQARMPRAHLVMLDAGQPGGKLRGAEVGGRVVDVGAESVLARRPEALELAASLGIADRLVHPATTQAAVWSRGRLHPLPSGTLMGVPADPASVRGILTDAEVERAEQDRDRAVEPLTRDVSVGAYLADRVGPAVVDRLVEPLLGGVYAGRADCLSLQATVPALWTAAASGLGPLAAAGAPPTGTGPVFAGIDGGVHTLAAALVARLLAGGAMLRTGAAVTGLDRTPTGWQLVTGPAPSPTAYQVDAVVLAVPAAPAARLLRPWAPEASVALADLEYASMAVVTYAMPRGAMPGLSGSGLLVPPVERRTVKAATFSSAKWAWLDAADPRLVWLRASIGRYGEQKALQRDDQDLLDEGLRDLAGLLGTELPRPVDAHVQRWGGALPQYTVGHLERVARVRAAVAALPGVELCGAAYEGVGIPACIATGRAAARGVRRHLRNRPRE